MNEQDDYQRGFEHAVRNIEAALENAIRQDNDDRRLTGLRQALAIAHSYRGFLTTSEPPAKPKRRLKADYAKRGGFCATHKQAPPCTICDYEDVPQ